MERKIVAEVRSRLERAINLSRVADASDRTCICRQCLRRTSILTSSWGGTRHSMWRTSLGVRVPLECEAAANPAADYDQMEQLDIRHEMEKKLRMK